MISLFNQLAESWCVVLFRCFRSVVLKLWYARAFKVVREQLSCHIRKALLIRFCVIIRSCVMLMLLIRLFAILFLSTFWANCVLLKPGVYTPTLKKHQAVRDLKKFENHCSKSLLSERGMEGRVSSNLKGGSCFRLKACIYFVLSTLMQCAAEPKYCAGVLGQLRGRATAHFRGNIAQSSF